MAKTNITCSTCAALRAEEPERTPTIQVPTFAPHIINRDDLMRRFKIVATSDTHAFVGDHGGILAFYVVPPDQRIRCSLSDRQRHGDGVVVETACGLILAVGHCCAEQWIADYGIRLKHHRMEVERRGNLNYVREWAPRCVTLAEVLLKEIREQKKWFYQHPEDVREILRRLPHGEAAFTVHEEFRRNDPIGKKHWSVTEIVREPGFIEEDIDGERVRRLKFDALELVDALQDARKHSDPSHVGALFDRCSAVVAELESVAEAVWRGRKFLEPANQTVLTKVLAQPFRPKAG